MIDHAIDSMKSILINRWFETVNSDRGISGRGGNKLRKYRLFKTRYETEQYCKIMPFRHKLAFAKFRTGVAPLRIETGRYEGIPEIERSCIFCEESVEDEIHALLECPLYNEVRSELIQCAQIANVNSNSLTKLDKFVFLFNNPNMIRSCAKVCFLILQRRTLVLSR